MRCKPQHKLFLNIIGILVFINKHILDFTEDVLSVLRAETLSGTVHSAAVTRREPSVDYFESGEGEDEPGDILLGVDIEVEVHGKPFEAVRP